MKVLIIYDNFLLNREKNLRAAMGFSCFIRAYNKNILFDTGWDGDLLLQNMKILGINYSQIDTIFISHNHGDHEGGLARFLFLNSHSDIFIPKSFEKSLKERIGFQRKEIIKKIHPVERSMEIVPHIFSTGEIEGIFPSGKQNILIKEQSMVIESVKGLVVIVGCGHSGIHNILDKAYRIGKIYALIGGFHDFIDYHLLKGIPLVVPTHCTENKRRIQELFPESYTEGGVGYELIVN